MSLGCKNEKRHENLDQYFLKCKKSWNRKNSERSKWRSERRLNFESNLFKLLNIIFTSFGILFSMLSEYNKNECKLIHNQSIFFFLNNFFYSSAKSSASNAQWTKKFYSAILYFIFYYSSFSNLYNLYETVKDLSYQSTHSNFKFNF